jgi:hypothetical protein
MEVSPLRFASIEIQSVRAVLPGKSSYPVEGTSQLRMTKLHSRICMTLSKAYG